MRNSSANVGQFPACLNRRDLLVSAGAGLGLVGLASVLSAAGELGTQTAGTDRGAPPASGPLAPRPPHFPPRAKRVIQFFLNGGPSHIDTFDPKPRLADFAGRPLPVSYTTERRTGGALPSPFRFQKYGQSGLEVSELFHRTAAHADSLAVIRSMHSQLPNHEPSLLLMNCGDAVQPRPSVGSWALYGLGTENQNLPGFVAMCPGGYPVIDKGNWQSGFLPGAYQGTYIDSAHRRVEQLIENIRSPHASTAAQRRQLDLLREMNEAHRDSRNDPRLDARIQSFELAFRMQMEAADAFDISAESQRTREMYGDHVHGRQTLIARRLLERGVRFVQLWHGAGQPWDHHSDIARNIRTHAGELDQPIAALLSDLKRRGMFDDTLVIWGGEFGRTPVSEGGTGRDHNPYGYTVWLAGGGVRGGTTYGATDEFGFRAVERPASVHDLHATILHLLGFDHERLTYRYAGRDFRLTDVHGSVLRDVLA
jgi:hypothetical protein